MVHFCMASILATLALDDEAMRLVNERNECHLVFESCLSLLGSTLRTLQPLDQSTPEDQDLEEQKSQQTLSVRLCEGCAQALWGSAYFCTLNGSDAVKLDNILKLSEIGLECVNNYKVGVHAKPKEPTWFVHKILDLLFDFLAENTFGWFIYRFLWVVWRTALALLWRLFAPIFGVQRP